MLKKILIDFHRDAQILTSKYHVFEAVFWIEAFWCFIRYGASPHDYVRYEFYKKRGREIDSFITAKRQGKICRMLNGDLQDDKYAMNRLLQEYMHRKWILIDEKANDEEILNFISEVGSVIVKPLYGSCGLGIYKINREEIKNEKSVCQEIRGGTALLEECIVQHEDMAKLNPYSVNTVRIFTIADKNGEVSVIDCIIRMGVTQACVDNAHAGGIYAKIDCESGMICNAARHLEGERRYLFSPMTGKRIVGRIIPSWEKILQMSKAVGKKMAEQGKRYVAQDIALWENGEPELIEVNLRGDSVIRQLATEYPEGKYRELKKYI